MHGAPDLPIAHLARLARRGALLGAAAMALLIAGCGSSSSSGGSTITVGNENQTALPAGATAAASVTTTSSTTSSAAINTPTSGPLSTEPKVAVPSGTAPTKLEVKDLITGTGAAAKAGETLTVNYVGVLYKGGNIFDASWNRKQTFSFPLGAGQVIPGWDQGLVGMKVGGRRELIIPANLAYGAQGSGSTIPPNSPLVFVIDLLGT